MFGYPFTQAMILCSRCIYPINRPDTHFTDGVCSACLSYDERKSINWADRLDDLKRLLVTSVRRDTMPYDVVVPVSGGKDSTFQVLKLKELGARVLAVNAATDYLSDIGRRNLDNIKRFCDVMEITPHIETRKKLVRIGLREIGDLSFPEHLAIWAIPTRIACQMNIPLVVWGEQPQREYASPKDVPPATRLDSAWVNQFGGMLGLRLSDLVGLDGLTESDLNIYRFPSDEELNKANVQGIWLGDYLDWDGWKNYFIAQQHGFECLPHPVETSLANYENADNFATVLRDYLRFLKYGYTRATDIACNHIRRGRLTRDEGLSLTKACEKTPQTSLGKPITEILGYFGISLEEWESECRKWSCSQKG